MSFFLSSPRGPSSLLLTPPKARPQETPNLLNCLARCVLVKRVLGRESVDIRLNVPVQNPDRLRLKTMHSAGYEYLVEDDPLRSVRSRKMR